MLVSPPGQDRLVSILFVESASLLVFNNRDDATARRKVCFAHLFRRFTSRIWRSQMNRRAVASSRLLKTIGRSPIQNGLKPAPITPAFQGLGVGHHQHNLAGNAYLCIIGSL
jgi:hypothetical protein